MQVNPAIERLLAALAQLDSMLEANSARAAEIRARLATLRARIEHGDSLPDVVEAEERPLVTELLTSNIEGLHEIGALFRRAEAAALRTHGYTMEQIAELFGVTRQRISALLKTDPEAEG